MSEQPFSASKSDEVVEIVQNVRMAFEPFQVPNFTRIRELGPFTSTTDLARIPAAHIKGLPDDILDKLVETWIADVYKKVGREVPFFHENTIEWATEGVSHDRQS